MKSNESRMFQQTSVSFECITYLAIMHLTQNKYLEI